MGSLLVKVKAKMSIQAHRKVQGLLEGEYGSIFKGRSIDFDDLREYIPGDDVKDIDWKATARSGQTLVKRYIAIRKHNILLVVDTGRNMAAVSESGESKKDIAVMVSGVLGYIAQKHGDLVALVSGDQASTLYLPLKGTNEHLERILQRIDTKTSLNSSPSNLSHQLEYIARNIRRRTMLIIISDDGAITNEDERLLRRLNAQHELMWVTIGDANIVDKKHETLDMYDVADELVIPPYIRYQKELISEFDQEKKERREAISHLLDRLQITNERVTSESDTISHVFTLLEKQKHVRR